MDRSDAVREVVNQNKANWRKCVQLSALGLNADEQAAALGKTRQDIMTYCSVARRQHGIMLHVPGARMNEPRPAIAKHLDIRGTPMGGIGRPFMNMLPDDVAKWLYDETPKGSTIADIVRAILVDAYNEASDA